MRRRIIGLAFCIAGLAVNAAAQGGSDSGGGPPATATITVSGTEQQVSGAWDTASITISFNGYTETVSPGQYSTSASIASAFAAKFSRDDTTNGLSAQVMCGSSGSLITFALASGTYGPLSVTGSTTSFQMTSAGFQAAQIAPTVTWPTPAAIGYGTALSAIQLNATATYNGATVPGTFAYNPPAGTVPATGTDTLSVTFTPTSSAYSTVTKSVSLTVLSSISDTGTVTLTVGGVMAATTTYGANASPSSIASGLANGVTVGSFVNLTAVNDQLNLVAKVQGAGTNYAYSIQTTNYDSTDFSQASFAYPVLSGSLDGGANADSTGQTQAIYSFTGAYDGVSNLTSYSDSAMGNMGFTYDSLNRLETAASSSGAYNGQHLCWAYDPFGNRLAEVLQTAACPTSEASVTPTATFNNINQATSASGMGAAAGYTFTATYSYDAAGDVTSDTTNQYLYDAEGRLCAVQSVKFGNSMIGYLYGADGTRVAKGSISSMSCDPTINHFATMSDYILGPSNEQLTELDMDSNGVMAWQHTNIWAGGKLLGTYDVDGTHFYFDDPLGTRRAQTDYGGVLEKTCQSLPYGNSESCPPSPTEHLFTGKERDTESGLDYFGARYYGSNMGRFMSPDWSSSPSGVPYADLGDPQSLNLYNYMHNNPLGGVDADGHWPQWLKDVARGAGKWVANQVTGNAVMVSHMCPACGEASGVMNIAGQNTAIYQSPSNTAEAVGYYGAAVVQVGAAVVPGFGGEATVSAAAPMLETEGASVSSMVPEVGQDVYRVWGGDAGPNGHSWSPVDPATVPNYRDAAGLPNVNTGTQLTTGTLTDTTGVRVQSATPLDGNQGGITEYKVPNPQQQIQIKSIQDNTSNPH